MRDAAALQARSGWIRGVGEDGRAVAAWLRGLAAVALALLVLLGAVSGVVAQDDRAAVLVDGHEIFKVGPAGDQDAAARARQVERRIELLLGSPDQIRPARVEPAGQDGAVAVTVAGVPVVVVTADDAADNLTTPDRLAATWAAALDAELAAASARRSSGLQRFVTEVRSAFSAAFLRLGSAMVALIPRTLAALLVLLLFGLGAKLVRGLLRIVFERAAIEPTIENLIRQVAFFGIWGFGVVAAISALGFDPQTVVTGLGLTGLALGFALKDILSNYVSGVLILAMRPFKLGDEITVGATSGEVEQIDLRATQIRTSEGDVVLVPNAEVLTSRIVRSDAPVYPSAVPVIVGYETDLTVAARMMALAAAGVDGVLPEPVPVARVRDLRADGVVIEVRYWTVAEQAVIGATADRVRRAVVEALRAAGVSLPNPAVRVMVPSDPVPGPATGLAD